MYRLHRCGFPHTLTTWSMLVAAYRRTRHQRQWCGDDISLACEVWPAGWFAGIDDPYEEPEAPELTLDARDASGKLQSVTAMAATVLQYLEQHHYLQAPEPHHTRTHR